MLNKMRTAIRRYEMVKPGDTVICAVSGGADSMALLWGMFLLKEKLGFRLEAAHFNHGLRGAESDSDAEFVRKFCDFHDIPLHLGSGNVVSGAKGLEAAARDARYAFLRGLKGTIATAHTADDNAETVLLHLIRGSGLRGLGGITPKSQGLIRPMLDVTRAEVEEFLNENYIRHIGAVGAVLHMADVIFVQKFLHLRPGHIQHGPDKPLGFRRDAAQAPQAGAPEQVQEHRLGVVVGGVGGGDGAL